LRRMRFLARRNQFSSVFRNLSATRAATFLDREDSAQSAAHKLTCRFVTKLDIRRRQPGPFVRINPFAGEVVYPSRDLFLPYSPGGASSDGCLRCLLTSIGIPEPKIAVQVILGLKTTVD